jgi:hypothetical protein
LWRIEHRQEGGGLQGRQNGFATLLVNGDPAWQRGGDAHVLVENLLRLLRLTDLEDKALTFELHALLRHGLFEVVNLHDAEVIGLDCSLQGSRSFTHGFVSGQFDQHSYSFVLNPSLHRRGRETQYYLLDRLFSTTTSMTTTSAVISTVPSLRYD